MNMITISVAGTTRKATISGDKVYIGDSSVSVQVKGIDDSRITTLAPCLQLLSFDNMVCAETMLQKSGDMLIGTLNTNTAQMLSEFHGLPHMIQRVFIVRIFSTTEAEPLALGRINIYNFPCNAGGTVISIPSAGEVLDDIQNRLTSLSEGLSDNSTAILNEELHRNQDFQVLRGKIEQTEERVSDNETVTANHKHNTNNPHNVTASQIGLGSVIGDIRDLRNAIQGKTNPENLLANRTFSIVTLRDVVVTLTQVIESLGGVVR